MVFKGVGLRGSEVSWASANTPPANETAATADNPAAIIFRRLRKSCSEVIIELAIGFTIPPCRWKLTRLINLT